MDNIELKYSTMTFVEQKLEQQKLEQNIKSLKSDLPRMDALVCRMRAINGDITHHKKELSILGKQKRFAEQEAKALCA